MYNIFLISLIGFQLTIYLEKGIDKVNVIDRYY